MIMFKFKFGSPYSSVGKDSPCNAGGSGLIPGSGRSTGERIGYPFQYSWTFLMTQMVKNPPAMWETWVQSLGWKVPSKRAWQATPLFLPGESPWTRWAWKATVHGVTMSQIWLSDSVQQSRVSALSCSRVLQMFCPAQVQMLYPLSHQGIPSKSYSSEKKSMCMFLDCAVSSLSELFYYHTVLIVTVFL